MTLQLVYAAVGGDLEKKIRELEKPIAQAATAAVKEAAAQVRNESRAAMLGAGFSGRTSRAMKSVLTPKTGDSINVSADFFLKPAYLKVFETGETITKTFMWIPLETVPFSTGSRRLSPKQYVSRIGPLFSARGARGVPLLVGKGTRQQVLRATKKFIRFRKGNIKFERQGTVNVPLFVGVDVVKFRKRFDFIGIVEKARSQLGALYLKNIKRISGG